jgi:hypothetical protein
MTIGPIVLTQPAGCYVASRSCLRSGQQSVYIYRLFPSTTPTYILHLNCAINTAVPLQMHSFSNQTVSSNNSFLSEALQMLCRCLHRLMLDLRYFFVPAAVAGLSNYLSKSSWRLFSPQNGFCRQNARFASQNPGLSKERGRSV